MKIYLIEFEDGKANRYYVKRLNRKSLTITKDWKEAETFTEVEEVTRVGTILECQDYIPRVYEFEHTETW